MIRLTVFASLVAVGIASLGRKPRPSRPIRPPRPVGGPSRIGATATYRAETDLYLSDAWRDTRKRHLSHPRVHGL